MAKGIIVVEIPEICGGCPCFRDEDLDCAWCGATGEYVFGFSSMNEYCPIKPLPEKIQYVTRQAFSKEQFAAGWNACIEEMLGE